MGGNGEPDGKALARLGYRSQKEESETYTFSVAHFSAIADFLQLRKKRPRPSEAQIARGRAALRDFHTRHSKLYDQRSRVVTHACLGGSDAFGRIVRIVANDKHDGITIGPTGLVD